MTQAIVPASQAASKEAALTAAEKKVKFVSAAKRAEQEAAGTKKSQGWQSLLLAGTLNGSSKNKRKGLGG
jgi:hypothetical protein